jgi:hypothetical protein
MSGEFYSISITLIGEKEGSSMLVGDPSVLWLNVLDGKSLVGAIYLSYHSQ